MDNSLIGNKKDGSSYKILIIDDSLFFIKYLSSILKSEGFEVIAAEDGEKGLEQYKAFYPNVDLVMLDIKMPNIDGMETLRNILEFDKDAKILVVSAIGKKSIIKDSLLIGAKDFIIKPIDKDKIMPKVQEILDKF